MNEYSIYCTEEQMNKALELGAPIEITGMYKVAQFVGVSDATFIIPTAEQMLGWLETQEDILDINIHLYEDDGYPKMCGYGFTIYNKNKEIITGTFTEKGNLVYICPKCKEFIYLAGTYENEFLTKKEATIAAIDVALDYLIKNKRK